MAWRLLQRGVVAAWGFLRREVLARILRERVIKVVFLKSMYSLGSAIIDFFTRLKEKRKLLESMTREERAVFLGKQLLDVIVTNFTASFITNLAGVSGLIKSKVTLALGGGLLQAVFGYFSDGSSWTFIDGGIDVVSGAVAALVGEWIAKKIFSSLSSNMKRWVDSISGSMVGTYVKDLLEGAKEASLKPGAGTQAPVRHSSMDCHVEENSLQWRVSDD